MTRENLKLVGVAAFCLTVGLAGPSVAGAVQKGLNADQVDGKHAVGAKAKIAKRKNGLVATNKQGYLPNNIIKSANKLGGFSAAQLRVIPLPAQGSHATDTANPSFQGVGLPDAVSASLSTGFVVPVDHAPGRPLFADVVVNNGAGEACNVYLDVTGMHSEPGQPMLPHGWRLPTGVFVGAVPLGFGGNVLTLRYEHPVSPGHSVGLSFRRSGAHASDSCTGPLTVTAIQIRY